MPASDSLRYPIGPFVPTTTASTADLERWIADLEAFPGRLRAVVAGLTDAQLDTPYRPGGWTVRQVVHHVGDSHTHAYVRFKRALTEEAPVISPYDEAAWAALPDVQAAPVEDSLAFVAALHRRWCALARALDASAFARVYVHPEDGPTDLANALGRYAWHGRHHLAHVSRLAEREGWSRPESVQSSFSS